MRHHRIVLDTNVLISAIVFSGPPRKVLELVISGTAECSISLAILDELRDVLLRPKFGFSSAQIFQVIEELHAVCDVIDPLRKVSVVAEDPDDNIVLECAMECNADFVVSGDAHLLGIAKFRNTQIVSPSAYLKTIRGDGDLPAPKASRVPGKPRR